MQRLKSGRYINATVAEVNAFVKEAEQMIEKYGWQEKTVMPYSFPVKVTKILRDLRDYGRCTKGSQLYLISLANGLAEIMEAWEKYELAEKVTIRIIKSGKLAQFTPEVAQEFIADGMAELV